MGSLSFLLLLTSSVFFGVNASSDASIAKAQKKFNSYQSDHLNLLRAIEADEYDQIYIQYHGCVWSEFMDNVDEEEEKSEDEDEDEQEDNNKNQSRCNGGINDDGDNPWYMGSTQCYRANVAYSLYGVRTGDDAPENACRKQYYINSFFTNNGMDYFGDALGLQNYDDATSQCVLSDNDNEAEGGDDNDSNQHNAQIYPNARSYTTYCASGKFVTAMFGGAYCTGKGELEMIDNLEDLNNELDQLDCVLAYSADDYRNANNRRLEEGEGEEQEGEEEEGEDREDEEDEEGEESQEGEDEGGNDEQKTIWDILSYSTTCSILEYPNGCPDPFGAKKRFDLNPRAKSRFLRWMHGIDWLTLVLFILGTFLLLLTCCIKDREPNNGKKRRTFGFRRSRSKSPSNVRENSKRNINDDASTVNTSGSRDARKKKGFFKRLFSRKK